MSRSQPRSLSLSLLLKDKKAFARPEDDHKEDLLELKRKMFRIQQGIWHQKSRAVIAFEGFDAAGKGGAIRELTEMLDPRGVRVHPIGAPSPEEQGKHWLYRFWKNLPAPGSIAVFDRTWYGRVLVERVEKLTDKKRWKQAYREINEFERMLQDDGIYLVKVFLAVSKAEQFKRFEERLKDPYKQWKISEDDIRARRHWDDYVEAVDDLLEETHSAASPWHLIPADHKTFARKQAMEAITGRLDSCGVWMKKMAGSSRGRDLAAELKAMKK